MKTRGLHKLEKGFWLLLLQNWHHFFYFSKEPAAQKQLDISKVIFGGKG